MEYLYHQEELENCTTTTTTKGAKSNLNLSKNMMNRLNEKKEINPIKAFDEFNLELFSNQKRLQIQLQN